MNDATAKFGETCHCHTTMTVRPVALERLRWPTIRLQAASLQWILESKLLCNIRVFWYDTVVYGCTLYCMVPPVPVFLIYCCVRLYACNLVPLSLGAINLYLHVQVQVQFRPIY